LAATTPHEKEKHMANTTHDVDQVLKALASQSVRQGANVRIAVRDLTLKALQQRELTLNQIGRVLRSVIEGAHVGLAKRETRVEKALSDTVAGMDDALLKAVHASDVALQRATGKGYDYEDSNLKQALDELERLEDEFMKSLAHATTSVNDKLSAPWQAVLKNTKLSGTAAGAHAASTVRDYARRAQAAMRAQRETSFKAAHLLTQNFATLASGVLIGMSEGLGSKRSPSRTAAKSVRDRRVAKPTKRTITKPGKGVTGKSPTRRSARTKATTSRKST